MATNVWYYSKDDERVGPVAAADLKQLAADGTILPTDLVWKQDWPDWKPANSIKGLFATAATATPPPTRKAPEAFRAATQAADDVSQKLWFLDLKFEQFATPRLIGFMFVGLLLLMALVGVGVIGYAFFNRPLIPAVFISIGMIIELVIFAIGLRVFLECCLVVFRIADQLSYLRHLKPRED